jgi:hypothetical protein
VSATFSRFSIFAALLVCATVAFSQNAGRQEGSVEKVVANLPFGFQLRADEAIVVIGLTPPAAKFFSYTPYLLIQY